MYIIYWADSIPLIIFMKYLKFLLYTL